MMKSKSFNRIFLSLCPMLLFGVFVGPATVFGQKQKVPTVAYCDLVAQPGKYAGKTVRVRVAVLALFHSKYMASRECNGISPEPLFNCSGEPKCDKARNRMAANSDGNGDVVRVEAILIGKLVVPPAPTSSPSRPIFEVTEIERSFKIPRNVPWSYY
ncbi:MAG: hypothetical protein IPL32_05260 [Chloracidobacterium sp.]|nr:hypothetical protein [Chloracidobacterium sp.]